MKGFIEVESKSNCKYLINIRHIEQVYNNMIYFAFNVPNSVEQDYICCKESFEEIKEKIRMAVEE